MKNFLLLFGMILVLAGCPKNEEITTPPDKPITSTETIPSEVLDVINDEVVTFDLRKPDVVMQLIERAGWQKPVGYRSPEHKQKLINKCQKKQELARRQGGIFAFAKTTLYGAHPTNPESSLCLVDVIPKRSAKGICEMVDGGTRKFKSISEDNHVFSCIKK